MILGIYGGPGLGGEVLHIAEHINAREQIWQEIVFVNDSLAQPLLNKRRVFSYEHVTREFSRDAFVFAIALGEPYFRSLLAARVRAGGYSLATLTHPTATVFSPAAVGAGSILFPNVFISSDTNIGENVLLMPSVVVMHETTLGSHTVCAAQTNIAGQCVIGEEVYFGLSSTLRERTRVGSRSIIGMGALVTADIGDNDVAMGSPARVVRKNESLRVFAEKKYRRE